MEKSGTFFIHKTQSMDFHPIVVHLPIGLLIGYGVIEIVQAIPKIKRYNLFQTKIILVISGTLGAMLAQQTGEIAGSSFRGSSLLHLHKQFAELTIQVFVVLSIIYVIQRYLMQSPPPPRKIPTFRKTKIAHIIQTLYSYRLMAVGALLGILLLTSIGALGGALVYGPDPIATFILNIFG